MPRERVFIRHRLDHVPEVELEAAFQKVWMRLAADPAYVGGPEADARPHESDVRRMISYSNLEVAGALVPDPNGILGLIEDVRLRYVHAVADGEAPTTAAYLAFKKDHSGSSFLAQEWTEGTRGDVAAPIGGATTPDYYPVEVLARARGLEPETFARPTWAGNFTLDGDPRLVEKDRASRDACWRWAQANGYTARTCDPELAEVLIKLGHHRPARFYARLGGAYAFMPPGEDPRDLVVDGRPMTLAEYLQNQRQLGAS